jgi:hypothetical protein
MSVGYVTVSRRKWWTHILGSSTVTVVSWANVSCNTSSSFSPSPSPLSATLASVLPTGWLSWLATTLDLRSLYFCRNLTSSNVDLPNSPPPLQSQQNSKTQFPYTNPNSIQQKSIVLNDWFCTWFPHRPQMGPPTPVRNFHCYFACKTWVYPERKILRQGWTNMKSSTSRRCMQLYTETQPNQSH